MGYFDNLLAPFNADIGINAANQAAAEQGAGITRGYNQLSDLYGQGRGALTTNFMAGLSPFQQNFDVSKVGMGALGNALGLSGPAGVNKAYESFKGTIQPAIQMGTQNVLRNAAMTGGGAGGGGAASGGTLAALQDLAMKQGMGGMQNYISALQPYMNMANTSAGGILSGFGNLGTGLNQSFTGQGGAAASAEAAKSAALANAALGSAQAKYGAGANQLGALFGAFGLGSQMLSDIRVKDDVERIGALDDGLPIYRWRYKGLPGTRIGVMAQDVERRNPDAVSEVAGLKVVDLKKASNYAADLNRYLEAA